MRPRSAAVTAAGQLDWTLWDRPTRVAHGFRPPLPGDAVEDTSAMRVALGNPGKVEILGVVAGHAELLHHPLRAEVRRRGIGEDLVEAERAETEIEGGPGAFGRIAPTPMRPGQPPADLDARGERRLEIADREADEADEGCDLRKLDGPEAEAMIGDMLPDFASGLLAPRARPRAAIMLHDLRIGVERREGGKVLIAPGPEDEALGPRDRPQIVSMGIAAQNCSGASPSRLSPPRVTWPARPSASARMLSA